MKNSSIKNRVFGLDLMRTTAILMVLFGHYKQIAEHLFLSERTVETHRKNIFRKTNTASVIGLIKFAYEHKLV